MRRSSAAAFALLLVLANPAQAQDDASVVVALSGGVDTLEVLRLAPDGQGGFVVTGGGSRPVLPSVVGPVPIRDLRVLADGSHVLGDVDGRGVAISDADGSSLSYEMRAAGTSSIVAAAVAGYAAVADPATFLIADAGAFVSLIDAATREVVWVRSMRVEDERGIITGVAALPSNRIAVAAHWRGLGLFAVDVLSVDVTQADARFASAAHTDATREITVLPELAGVRDVFGLPAGGLLVTTDSALYELGLDGTLREITSTSSEPRISGQLVSARMLPSGHVALATAEAGVWVQAHTNHRVHWVAFDSGEVLATSPALPRAPARLDALLGHGGTGTLGFTGGFDGISPGDATLLEAGAPLTLDAREYEAGDVISARALIDNPSAGPVSVDEAEIVAAPVRCETLQPLQGDPRRVVVANNVAIPSDTSFVLRGGLAVDARFLLGEWCAWLLVSTPVTGRILLGEPVGFEVVDAVEGTEPVKKRELDFRRADTGSDDAGDAGAEPENPGADPPCECSYGRPGTTKLWLVLLTLLGFVGRRRGSDLSC